MEVEELIAEMQDVKADHQTLEISEVLRIFEIKALQDLAAAIWRAANK